MSDELQWLGALINASNTNPEVAPVEVVSTSEGKKLTFTVKDWELLMVIASFAEEGEVTPSNATLGAVVSLGNGAVSARIKRLQKMGLIEVEHFNATDTGVNNVRVIRVLGVPPRPWSPS